MYYPPNPWTGRIDHPTETASLRWHQMMRYWDLTAGPPALNDQALQIALIGFQSDEGVRRNQGRTGAFQGPVALRRVMAGFPAHFPGNLQLWDAGNVVCDGAELEAAQSEMAGYVAMLLQEGVFPIVLGGGHETAWTSYTGLRTVISPKTPLGIINVDAHFDLRQSAENNSGTAFLQMAKWSQEQNSPFNYLVLGIQETGNTFQLFQTADNYEVQYLTAEALQVLPFSDILSRIDFFLDYCDLIYLSIDLDAFDVAFAPGVSAPTVLGLHPLHFLPLLRHLIGSGKLALVDICELNPDFDLDNRTARLGARWVWEVVQSLARSR